jgi:hypothetical protein
MKHHIDPNILQQVANEVIALPLADDEMFQAIREKLAEHYPHLISAEKRCWIGSRAGGVLGKMTLLYANMNEYLIIFGAPAGSQGFSGRYNFVQIWDFFLAGEAVTCDLENEQIIASHLKPGDMGFLDKGQSLSCELKAGTWMIEYGRGPNITSLPFALMDSLVSSVELKSLFVTIKEYSHFILKSFR